jgi:hypothetical protein
MTKPYRRPLSFSALPLAALLGVAGCYGDIIPNDAPVATGPEAVAPTNVNINLPPMNNPPNPPSAVNNPPNTTDTPDGGANDAGMMAPGGPRACATAAEISAKILVPKCGTCHGKMNPAAGLDLVTAGSKARMLDVTSKACGTRKLIVTSPAVGGHFFDKLEGSVSGCGVQMPPGGPWLTADEISCLKEWVAPPAP